MAFKFDIGNFLGGLFSSGGSALGSFLSYKQQRKLMQEQSQIQYNNQRSLNQNAYQDTVSSMRSAGINPMLAIGNGASGGSAGMPNASSQPMDLDPTTAYATLKQVRNDTELKVSQKELNRSQQDLNTYSADKAHHEASYAREQTQLLQDYGPLMQQAQLEGLISSNAKIINDIANSNALTRSQINLNSSTAKAQLINATQGNPWRTGANAFRNIINDLPQNRFSAYAKRVIK